MTCIKGPNPTLDRKSLHQPVGFLAAVLYMRAVVLYSRYESGKSLVCASSLKTRVLARARQMPEMLQRLTGIFIHRLECDAQWELSIDLTANDQGHPKMYPLQRSLERRSTL